MYKQLFYLLLVGTVAITVTNKYNISINDAVEKGRSLERRARTEYYKAVADEQVLQSKKKALDLGRMSTSKYLYTKLTDGLNSF